jgi:hypothetical protein
VFTVFFDSKNPVVVIFATGALVHKALSVAKSLKEEDIEVTRLRAELKSYFIDFIISASLLASSIAASKAINDSPLSTALNVATLSNPSEVAFCIQILLTSSTSSNHR